MSTDKRDFLTGICRSKIYNAISWLSTDKGQFNLPTQFYPLITAEVQKIQYYCVVYFNIHFNLVFPHVSDFISMKDFSLFFWQFSTFHMKNIKSDFWIYYSLVIETKIWRLPKKNNFLNYASLHFNLKLLVFIPRDFSDVTPGLFSMTRRHDSVICNLTLCHSVHQ